MNTLGFQYSLYTKGDYISATNNLCINNIPVINSTSLGPGIINSNLTSLGTILNLNANNATINTVQINNILTINGTNNTIPVIINSYGTDNSLTSYNYFDANTNTITSNTISQNISLKASKSIWTQGAFVVSSDERIKTNIQKADTAVALQNILDLPLMSFNYIDNRENGGETVMGMIAQNVMKVVPSATTTTSGIIPSIYKLATNIELIGDNILLTVPINDTVLIISKKLEIIVDNIGKILVNIIDFTATNILVSKWENFDITKSVFVYGPEINDMLTVDEPYLGILCMGGIQELHSRFTNINSNMLTISNLVNTSVMDVNVLKTYNTLLTNLVNKINSQTTTSIEQITNQLNTHIYDINSLKTYNTLLSNLVNKINNQTTSVISDITNKINTNTSDLSILKTYNTLLSNLINKINNHTTSSIEEISNKTNNNITEISTLKTYNTLLSNLINKINNQINSTISDISNQINTNMTEISTLKTYNTLLSNLINKINNQTTSSISDISNQVNTNMTEISTLKTYNTLLSNLINKINNQTTTTITDISNQTNANSTEVSVLKTYNTLLSNLVNKLSSNIKTVDTNVTDLSNIINTIYNGNTISIMNNTLTNNVVSNIILGYNKNDCVSIQSVVSETGISETGISDTGISDMGISEVMSKLRLDLCTSINSSTQIPRLTILSNGNVGIGNILPSVNLDITGTTRTNTLIVDNIKTNNTNFTLPNNNGSSGHVLGTDGLGNTQWIDITKPMYLKYSDTPNIISYWNGTYYNIVNNYDNTISNYYYLSWENNNPKEQINLSNSNWNNTLFTVPINGLYNINITLKTSTQIYLFISKGTTSQNNIILNNLIDYDTLIISAISNKINNDTHVASVNSIVKLTIDEYLIFGIYSLETGIIIPNSNTIAPNSQFTITMIQKL